MSKDQKKTKPLSVENVEKLKFSCRVINEILSGIKYWNYDQIWPINLYSKILEKVIEKLNCVIYEVVVNEKVN